MGKNLEKLFHEMAELTLPECQSCRVPLSCCSSEYCEIAADIAREKGVILLRTAHTTLPYMSPTGCTVPPHFRPLCTLHTCAINNHGFKPGDPVWTSKYFDLRNDIQEAIEETI